MAVFPTGHVKQRTAYALVLLYWRAWSPNRRRLLLYKCRFSTMNSDAVILLETVNFAAEKHRNQRRKDTDQTPYINHPVGRKCFSVTFSWCVQGALEKFRTIKNSKQRGFLRLLFHILPTLFGRAQSIYRFLLQWLVIFLTLMCY